MTAGTERVKAILAAVKPLPLAMELV